MAISGDTFIRDILFFIKNDFLSNISDPLVSERKDASRFVMTSYPQRLVEYPLVTLKVVDYGGTRAGMQTNAMDIRVNIEIRVWGRNQKEKDEISNDCYIRLRDIQFTATDGSVANNLHDFTLISSVELDEDGEEQPKSRVLNVGYSFFDL